MITIEIEVYNDAGKVRPTDIYYLLTVDPGKQRSVSIAVCVDCRMVEVTTHGAIPFGWKDVAGRLICGACANRSNR